jgi:hypothetical protein
VDIRQKRTKGITMICKTLHRKLNFELSICSSITAGPAYEIKQKFSVDAI